MTLPAKVTLSAKLLLKDPVYKKWAQKPPKLTAKGTQDPWRVFVLKPNGKWAKKDFPTYAKAFNWMAKNLGKYPDIVIHSKRQRFKPPVVRYKGKKTYWPSPRGYRWCPYCRRPTKFKYFKSHHAQPLMVPWYKRCHVCGVRAESLPIYESSVPPTIEL